MPRRFSIIIPKALRTEWKKSYQEIKHLLHLMRLEEMEDRVFRGSETYLKDEKTPVISPAAEHLCALAMEYSAENPLYVVSIGAITNIASAILLRPEITERIVVVWLGGNAVHWPNNREFNLIQDIAAAAGGVRQRRAACAASSDGSGFCIYCQRGGASALAEGQE